MNCPEYPIYSDQTNMQNNFYNQINLQNDQNLLHLQNTKSQEDKQFEKLLQKLQNNKQCNISKFFKEDLQNSWEQYKSQVQPNLNVDSDDVNLKVQDLISQKPQLENQSLNLWDCVQDVFGPQNDDPTMHALQAAGIWRKIVPSTVFPLMCSQNLNIAPEIKSLIQRLGVCLTELSRIERCENLILNTDFLSLLKRELKNPGHQNWDVSEYPEWLLLELEHGFLIRPTQIDVAKQMLHPEISENMVMQLNMGEGKTSVILPLLAATLANSKQLVRIVVLTSLITTNYEQLAFKLGGLLNQKLAQFPCNRSMKFDSTNAEKLLKVYQQSLENRIVVVTTQENLLSFQLKVLEVGMQDENIGNILQETQNWLENNARDVLDESDEILHVKYQLVYTIGSQIHVDGGSMRWRVAQVVLDLVKKFAAQISDKFGSVAVEFVESKNENSHKFPYFRILSDEAYVELCALIAFDILDGQTDLPTPQVSRTRRRLFMKFILQEEIGENEISTVLGSVTKGVIIDIILVLRGLLGLKVLKLALQKRWRVNYGVHPRGRRRMAVPYRAKDVASERTEFGHPDVAIILTLLTYYFGGLTQSQMWETFERLKVDNKASQIYNSWIQEHKQIYVKPSLRHLSGVNLIDQAQFQNEIYPLFKFNTKTINYWLDNCVFPQETLQFPSKLVASPWDLCKRVAHPVTGFSGTNDSRLLLPTTIEQRDLLQLKSTNGEVVYNLLNEENNYYRDLPANVTGELIIDMIAEHDPPIKVLLDCGALIIELSNRQVAEKWLEKQRDANAVVYFNKKNQLVVMDRNNKILPLNLSPYLTRLNECIIYLDDDHTRGTDMKIPENTRACVTLGKNMLKEKLVQACMRMRQLGSGHTVTFWASQEVHTEICNNKKQENREIQHISSNENCVTDESDFYVDQNQDISKNQDREKFAPDHNFDVNEFLENFINNTQITICSNPCNSQVVMKNKNENDSNVCTADVLFWAINNTIQMTSERMLHWAKQGLSFYRKLAANKTLEMGSKCCICTDQEMIELENFYGQERHLIPIVQIVQTSQNIMKAKFQNFHNFQKEVAQRVIEDAGNTILQRCDQYVKNISTYSNDLDEEQERELELELENEQEKQRPNSAKPHPPKLHPDVVRVVKFGDLDVQNSKGFVHLPHALNQTTFDSIIQHQGWSPKIFASKEFCTVLSEKHLKMDNYLRPVSWVICDQQQNVVLLSGYEINQLFHQIRNNNSVKLYMYNPKIREDQNSFILNEGLCLPKNSRNFSIESKLPSKFQIPDDFQQQITVFSSGLFFDCSQQQDNYCYFLGLCPAPRNDKLDILFENGLIDQQGFLNPRIRQNSQLRIYDDMVLQNLLERCNFEKNPIELVLRIIQARGFEDAMYNSHADSILNRCSKKRFS